MWVACSVFLSACGPGGAIAQEPTLDATDLPRAYTSEDVEALRNKAAEQAAGTVDASPVAGPIDPRTYRMGPGDVLQVNLTGRITRQFVVTVGAEGQLFVPNLGSIDTDGLMLAELRDQLSDRVADRLNGVRLNVQLMRVRSMRIYVTGAVKQPGAIEVPATSRVSDILPRTALEDGASRRNVEVVRRDGTRLIADLELFERLGRMEQNPYLVDGDVVRVPVASEFVEIRGAVARPGSYELGPSDSLMTLMDIAGGPLPSALVDHALMLRWVTPTTAESTFFNLESVYRHGFNPSLKDGDRVFIYLLSQFHLLEQASIFGEVLKPGTYPLSTGQTRLSDLVASAGGFTSQADLSTIRIYRKRPGSDESDPEFERLQRLSRAEMTDSEYEVLRTRLAERRDEFRVDWSRVRQSQELDIILRQGDVVRVDPLIASVRVDGEVRRPGIVAFDPQRDVNEYVRLAGGYSKLAARGRVLITRAVTGQTLRARDVPNVSPGDLIWVPERKSVDFWAIFREGLAVAGQIAVIVVATRR